MVVFISHMVTCSENMKLLVCVLLLQMLYHHSDRERVESRYRGLAEPFGAEIYRAGAIGSEQLLGYLLALRLQLHDNQAGQHFDYGLIDYALLVNWLDVISDISPGTEYPMLLASRVYTNTRDPAQLRQLIAFIERRFDEDPQLHWRRLTEASLIARHRLGDLELALVLAQKLARQPARVVMPRWARDFEFLLLAELNELESAIAIIEVMLASDSIDDPDERHFLQTKLSEFQHQLFESRQKPSG